MNHSYFPQTQIWPVAETPPLLWLPDLVGFLRRRAVSILVTTAVVLAIVCVYIVVAPARFTATVQLLVDAEHADPFRQQPASASNPQSENTIVDSEVEVIRSEGIARLVVRDLNLANDNEFMSFGETLLTNVTNPILALFASSEPMTADQRVTLAAELLVRLTDARRIGLSDVIEVAVRTTNPQRSAQLANAIAAAYLNEQLNAKLEIAGRAGTWLSAGIAHVRQDAMTADRAVQAFKETYHIVDTDKGSMIEQKLADINADLTLARNRTAEAQARVDGIDAILAVGIGDASVSDAMLNPVIVRLRQQYFDASNRVTELTPKYGPNHLAVIKLRQDMEDLKAASHDELQRIAEGYRSDLAVATANEFSLQQDYKKLVDTSDETNKLRVNLRDLMSSADIYRQLYQNFLQRYTQAVQDQTFPIPQARVFTAATTPLEKSWPRGRLLVGLGTIVGIIFGCGVGFVREAFDRGLCTPSQVKSAMNLECIALLPSVTKLPGERRNRPRGQAVATTLSLPQRRLISTAPTELRIVKFDPLSPFSEALRAVTARLTHLQLRSKHSTVIGCISALPGEGKTTIAANLAQLLAESGKRTILLDWDLRKRDLTQILTSGCERGFGDPITGDFELDDLLFVDERSGLHMLPTVASMTERHAGAVLGSPQTTVLLNKLRARVHHIVIDVPALSPVADTQGINHLFDTVLVVVEWGQTDRDLTAELLLRGQFEFDRILGVVLNKVDPRTLKRYVPAKLSRPLTVEHPL